MIYGIITLALGLFSIILLFASGEKKNKLQPVAKYGGIGCLLLGIWGIISCVIGLDMLPGQMLAWVTRLVVSLELATLGAMLALVKNQGVLFKSLLGTMSIIGVGLGICQIIVSVICWPQAIIY